VLSSILQQATDFIRTHSFWAAPIAFALGFFGSFVGSNVFIPAGTILTSVAVLIGAGIVSWTFVVCAAAGATLGISLDSGTAQRKIDGDAVAACSQSLLAHQALDRCSRHASVSRARQIRLAPFAYKDPGSHLPTSFRRSWLAPPIPSSYLTQCLWNRQQTTRPMLLSISTPQASRDITRINHQFSCIN
jgi:hypothetical protein